jgi:proteasome lid subunit RPN8/RPN11
MPRSISPKIWLSENAFVSMVSASVEAFKDETLGVLLGLREPKHNRFMVQYAIVCQTVERTRVEVHPDLKRAKRLNEFLENVTYLDTIGYFHSHPELPVEKLVSCQLSNSDKHAISVGDVELVIAIDEDRKERDWHHLSKGSLLGSVFPYSLKISAWFKTENNEFRISKIHCPFALGLGR